MPMPYLFKKYLKKFQIYFTTMMGKFKLFNYWQHNLFLQNTSACLPNGVLPISMHKFSQHVHPCHSTAFNASKKNTVNEKVIQNGPGFEHFIANLSKGQKPSQRMLQKISHPYVKPEDVSGHGRRVYFDVHGCQMNVNDIEVTWAVLKSAGYQRTGILEEADVILLMTCAIREGAEQKIWNKIRGLAYLKKRRPLSSPPLKIGVLGCMAERLKNEMLEKEKIIDLVMGPDSYRDLPRLLAITQTGDRAINVLLSQEETYADIMPVSLSQNRVSAFVSIMRGCNNMCSYCIVPFTRGQERSRPIDSILSEVKELSQQGIKEVTLLGQNVNSYCDTSETHHCIGTATSPTDGGAVVNNHLSEGFHTIYKPKRGGLRFGTLLDKVSQVDPEMRVRFTSPHPKDFPNEVLTLISERRNICKHIHLPAQSGNSRVLEVMRRGYTRETYLKLVQNIRSIIPGVSLSSDFISGFCSETEEEFNDTITLMEAVKYNFCYVFAYSLREKTSAHRDLVDDVPESVKGERLMRMSELFRKHALQRNMEQVGQRQLVLVEGNSRRSELELAGRNDLNTKVIFPNCDIECCGQQGASGDTCHGNASSSDCPIFRGAKPGDYVEVLVTSASSQVLHGVPLLHSTLHRGARTESTGAQMALHGSC